MRGLNTILSAFILIGCTNSSNNLLMQANHLTNDELVYRPFDQSAADTLKPYMITPAWTLDSILNLPVQALIDSGITVSPSIYRVNFHTQRKFKGEWILLAIDATVESNGSGKVDVIKFTYKNKQHELRYLNFIFFGPQVLYSIKSNRGITIRLDDFNFDGHPDVAVYNSEASGMKNIAEDIYIFNVDKNAYFRNKILSESSNVYADSVSKTVSTFGQGGMASQIYGSSFYKWKEGKLEIFKSQTQDYNSSLNRFIRETKELVNGKWVISIDTLRDEELTR
ncbi:MAG: hypothetical protein K8H85_02845 [Cyclobacteriaceae bacterium]|nr:hypothetical protein [Cyclobacteriaceae bacterium]